MQIENYLEENRKLREEIRFLRERLAVLEEMLKGLQGRNSKNSSVPPSTDRKANTKGSSNRGGAKPGHEAHHRKLVEKTEVDETHVHEARTCPRCGGSQLAERDGAPPFQFTVYQEAFLQTLPLL